MRRIANSTKGSSLKQCIFQKKLRIAYSIGALDAPAQGPSFYVEKTSFKIGRVKPEMVLESAIFKQKVPSHIFRQQPIKFHYLQV